MENLRAFMLVTAVKDYSGDFITVPENVETDPSTADHGLGDDDLADHRHELVQLGEVDADEALLGVLLSACGAPLVPGRRRARRRHPRRTGRGQRVLL